MVPVPNHCLSAFPPKANNPGRLSKSGGDVWRKKKKNTLHCQTIRGQ